jgi:hypothetical protein
MFALGHRQISVPGELLDCLGQRPSRREVRAERVVEDVPAPADARCAASSIRPCTICRVNGVRSSWQSNQEVPWQSGGVPN